MALKSYLIDPDTGKTMQGALGIRGKPVIIAESVKLINGLWQLGANAGAETVTIVEAKPSEAILITDILITSVKKVNSGTVVVQFSDGTNTEQFIPTIDAEIAPVEWNHSFSGGLRGWADADIQVTTNQAAMVVSTLVGYIRLSKEVAHNYGVWNEGR